MTPAEIARALGGARREGQVWKALCPCHNDKDPSLDIEIKDGTTVFICRAGCDQNDVVAELKRRRLWGANGYDKDPIAATYDYTDEAGKLLFQVVRKQSKKFLQRRPDGVGEWIWNLDGIRIVPYRLPELVEAQGGQVFVAEGEKDVDRLRSLGMFATCNPMGAGKWRAEFAPYFAGVEAIVLPDNDNIGRKHANTVAANLVGVATTVRILDLPGLPDKGDVSDWLNAGGTRQELERRASEVPLFRTAAAIDPEDITVLLSGAAWLTRDIPEPDFMLGELISTTNRIELIGPTGIGKSNVLLAMAIAIAEGRDFLHWRGGGKPRRVLYLDGEMSRRLAKRRLVDAARRHGRMPATFFYFNREDFPNFPPLNTEAGQRFIDNIIDAIGGVDLVILDNVQALLAGDMKDEEPWQQTLPWVRELTSRSIGQIWAHHTGHDETHGYGSKTREWQLDAVALMEVIERPDTDIAFALTFTKARERAPENRSDFDPATIILTNDTWSSERNPAGANGKRGPAKDRAFELLKEAISRDGTIPPASSYIPPNTRCVTIGLWRRFCDNGMISTGDDEAKRKAFERAAAKLVDKDRIVGKWELWVWIIPDPKSSIV